MCTKSRAVELGCIVGGSYSDNQLVKYSDLSPAKLTATPTSLRWSQSNDGQSQEVQVSNASNISYQVDMDQYSANIGGPKVDMGSISVQLVSSSGLTSMFKITGKCRFFNGSATVMGGVYMLGGTVIFSASGFKSVSVSCFGNYTIM